MMFKGNTERCTRLSFWIIGQDTISNTVVSVVEVTEDRKMSMAFVFLGWEKSQTLLAVHVATSHIELMRFLYTSSITA
jgi:hypothetical protein